MNPVKELPFTRSASLKNLFLDLDGGPDINLNARYKFFAKINSSGKFIARTPKGPGRYGLSDTPFVYYSEVEANQAVRSFKGAVLIKEEAINN